MLLLIATACLLFSCHHLDGFWAVFIDASVLLVAIVVAGFAKRNRFYVIMSIYWILILFLGTGLALELRTAILSRCPMKVTLYASSNTLWLDGKIVDIEEFNDIVIKDFMRYGVARNIKLSFEPGCAVSNVFRLCEMDAELFLSRGYVLDLETGCAVFRRLWQHDFNKTMGDNILMFIVEPESGLGNLFYRLNSSALCQLFAWTMGNASHNSGFNCQSLVDENSIKLNSYTMAELSTIEDLQMVDVVLIVDQKTSMQKLRDSVSYVAQLFPRGRIFITPTIPGFDKWAEKSTTLIAERQEGGNDPFQNTP